MSAKERLITYSYKKTKHNQENLRDIKREKDVKPCTSKSEFENDMEILRAFDLQLEYGPSVGITRLERWKRADKHGLNPSVEVKELILEHSDDERYTQCLWNDYKNII